MRPVATWPAVWRRAAAGTLAVLLAVLLAACGGRASKPSPEDPRRPTVTLASLDFPESELLVELYAQVLAARGLPVERIMELGSREVVEPALESGTVDLVPEYLGTAVNFLSGGRLAATTDSRKDHAELARLFAARGVSVLAYAPAQDQNGIAVARARATARHLARLSDLRPIADELIFGAPAECAERLLCLVPVVRTEIVERYGQRLVDAVNAVSARLTTPDLIELNRQATLGDRPVAAVARGWLVSHHLVP